VRYDLSLLISCSGHTPTHPRPRLSWTPSSPSSHFRHSENADSVSGWHRKTSSCVDDRASSKVSCGNITHIVDGENSVIDTPVCTRSTDATGASGATGMSEGNSARTGGPQARDPAQTSQARVGVRSCAAVWAELGLEGNTRLGQGEGLWCTAATRGIDRPAASPFLGQMAASGPDPPTGPVVLPDVPILKGHVLFRG
jgi:hypothetical protein